MLYASGQLLTEEYEEYYVANKFTKGFLSTNTLDSNSRLCMSSAVADHKRAFGSDTHLFAGLLNYLYSNGYTNTAHFELKNRDHRQTVADFWQTSHVISPHDGIKATQCADAILEGQILQGRHELRLMRGGYQSDFESCDNVEIKF